MYMYILNMYDWIHENPMKKKHIPKVVHVLIWLWATHLFVFLVS